MSAYVVEDKHITYLLEAAASPSILGHQSDFSYWFNDARHSFTGVATERIAKGQMLLDANVRSVSHCYGKHRYEKHDEYIAYEPGSHVWDTIDPVHVLKACHCFEYQCSETPDWKESEAYAFIQDLKAQAERMVPGYEDAEWGSPEPTPNRTPSLI